MLSNKISILFDRLNTVNYFLHSYMDLQKFLCCKIRVSYNILKYSFPEKRIILNIIYKSNNH